MKTTGIVALTLLSVAAAAPHAARHHRQLHDQAKRDIVYVTDYFEVVETVIATTTVWVDGDDVPATTAPTTTETPEAPAYTPPAAPTTTSSSSSSSSVEVPAYTPPAPSTTETPSSTYVAPSSTYVAPTSTYVPPAEPSTTTSSAVVAAETAASDSSAGSSDSSLPSDLAGVKTDCEATWYNTMGAYGACGGQHYDTEKVVALKQTTYNNIHADACNRSITVEYNGKSTTAMLVDSCPGCVGPWDIDLSPPVFEAVVGDLGVGRVSGLKWWFN